MRQATSQTYRLSYTRVYTFSPVMLGTFAAGRSDTGSATATTRSSYMGYAPSMSERAGPFSIRADRRELDISRNGRTLPLTR